MVMRAPIAALAVSLLLAGCQTEQALRYEGVTPGAGNAIAANTVMQMVDPWPAGVENTHLATPADHGQYRSPAAGAPAEDYAGGVEAAAE